MPSPHEFKLSLIFSGEVSGKIACESLVNLPDKRQAERFRCQIPILVKQGHGVTRDFSIEGVYFVTDQSLALGEQLDFTLHLNHADPVWPIRLSCRGEVIRLEPGVEKTGVAVLITSHRLEGAPGFG